MNTEAIQIVGGDMSFDRWLLTTAIGGDYFDRWNDHVRPSWERYAAKHGLGVAVVVSDLFVDGEPEFNGAWQKMLAPRALRDVVGHDVRCAMLDTDLYIAPGAASIFDAVPEGKIGVVSQEVGLPLPAKELRNRIALLRRRFLDPGFPLSSILNATPRQTFEWAGFEGFDDYFCTGMLVVDTAAHADDLALAYRSSPQDPAYDAIGAWEEVWLNHWVQSRDDVVWLDYRWHALWIFEVAAHYPFLYAPDASVELARWCFAASLMRNEFVHLAGGWESALLGEPSIIFPLVDDAESFLAEVRRHEGIEVDAVQRGSIAPPAG